MNATTVKRRTWLATLAPLGLIGLCAAATLAAGCASQPELRHDRDPAADFQAYKTFAFHEGEQREPLHIGQRPAAQAGYTTLQEARLRQATRQQLERQGFIEVAQNPDLRVHLLLKVIQRQELHATPAARFGYRGLAGWGSAEIDTVDVRQGSLVIDLVDARRNALVWRGVAEGSIDHADARDPGPAIDRAVAEVFTGFKR
jgi:hypothetical protein